MIPKIIHQIWIGPNKMPVEWMDTWRDKNPNMEYRVWTEVELETFGLRFKDKCDALISEGEYRGASDIMRVELLDRYGGVYVDVDSICLEPIEDAPFMNTHFFVGKDYDHKRNKVFNRVANGTIGATSRHPVIKDYLDRISKTEVTKWWEIGGKTLTSCIKNKSVTVLPICTFYPKNWDGRSAPVEGKIYADHIWGTTRGKYHAE